MNRILIAAPKSGSGKTVITCALLQAWKDQGLNLRAYKCGPDYIDPMFHRQVLGIPSGNLDTYLAGEETVRGILASDSREYAVMEGVMGLFDGLGGTEAPGSSYDLARVTKTPIILVMDVHGMGRTMISLLKGILLDDEEKLIRGVILNRISESFYKTMKPIVEGETGISVLGYFPTNSNLHLESRHLGLKLPREIQDLQGQLREAATNLIEHVDLAKIREIAESAGPIAAIPKEKKPILEKKQHELSLSDSLDTDTGVIDYNMAKDSLRLGVARDEAFCFYYEENLELLKSYGIELIEFSPLRDTALPENLDGLLLGGGYPELYCKELSENTSMREALYQSIKIDQIPTLAECGGFLYLQKKMVGETGINYPQVGVLTGSCENQGHLVRFGYVEISEKQNCFLSQGESIRGHEFHYYDTTENGQDCVLKKSTTGKSWEAVVKTENQFLGFPHLYYLSNPQFVEYFVEEMKKYHNKIAMRLC